MSEEECKRLDSALESLCRNGADYTAAQADRLVADGYADVLRTGTGSVYLPTERGKMFLRTGGYTAQEAGLKRMRDIEEKENRKGKWKSMRKELWEILGLILSVAALIASILLSG